MWGECGTHTGFSGKIADLHSDIASWASAYDTGIPYEEGREVEEKREGRRKKEQRENMGKMRGREREGETKTGVERYLSFNYFTPQIHHSD